MIAKRVIAAKGGGRSRSGGKEVLPSPIESLVNYDIARSLTRIAERCVRTLVRSYRRRTTIASPPPPLVALLLVYPDKTATTKDFFNEFLPIALYFLDP